MIIILLYLISLRLIFLLLITKLNYFEAQFKDLILCFNQILSILNAYQENKVI